MAKIVAKKVKIPDNRKLLRYEAAPKVGPYVLFFSGGSALKDLSKTIITYTYNSIHLITPFDSGGSSAKLREAFEMPAVGDIRNRLLALADINSSEVKRVHDLLSFRLSKKERSIYILEREVEDIIRGIHPLIQGVSFPFYSIIKHYLEIFFKHKPKDFDLRGASIGNLVLTGAYLDGERDMDFAIFVFSNLVFARGVVRPVVNENLHIGARCEDNSLILGQHLITGKEVPSLKKKIDNIFFIATLNEQKRCQTEIDYITKYLINKSELICYPMGSFFTSLIATLMPYGVAEAIAKNPCPKVFIPNTFEDPELYGYSVKEQVEFLLGVLKEDNKNVKTEDVLNFLVLDKEMACYSNEVTRSSFRNFLKNHNIIPIFSKLIISDDKRIDPKRLCEVLLSLT